eukprot:g3444.t1
MVVSVLAKCKKVRVSKVNVTDKLKKEIWKHSTKKLLNMNKEYTRALKEWTQPLSTTNHRGESPPALDIRIDGIGSAVKGTFKAYGFEGYKKDWNNTYIMWTWINGHPAFLAFDIKTKQPAMTDSGYLRCLYFDAVNHRWCLELTDRPFIPGIPMLCLPVEKTKYKAHSKKFTPCVETPYSVHIRAFDHKQAKQKIKALLSPDSEWMRIDLKTMKAVKATAGSLSVKIKKRTGLRL